MKKIILLAILVLATAAPAVEARPGAPDPEFGENGKVIGGSGGSYLANAEAAVAKDGSIFTATVGEAAYVPVPVREEPVKLQRHLPGGQLDTSFGEGGTVLFRQPPSWPPLAFDLRDLAVDNSGRPLLFGLSRGALAHRGEGLYDYNRYPSHAAVVRFTADGRLDSSFGGDGVAMFDFGPPAAGENQPTAEVSRGGVDPRGRIVLVGALRELVAEGPRGSYRPADRLVARVTSSGDLDPSFGDGDGMAPLGTIDQVSGMSFGPGGTLTLAGTRTRQTAARLLRLDEDGRRVASFGKRGARTYPKLRPSDVEVDRRGRTLLLGNGAPSVIGPPGPPRVLRMRRDGSLDRSFGVRGRVTIGVRKETELTGIAAERSGRLLLTGRFPRGKGPAPDDIWRLDMGVLRLLSDGRVDRGFGRSGRVFADLRPESSARRLTEAVVDSSGRLVLSAEVILQSAPMSEIRQVLFRYELR